MYRVFSLIWIFFILLTFNRCSSSTEKGAGNAVISDTSFNETNIEFAQQFRIEYGKGYKIVEVLQPFPGAAEGFRYLLIPRGMDAPSGVEADAIVKIPVREMVSLSTTHIPALQMLGASDVLSGFPDTDLISSADMRRRIDEGKVQDLGSTSGINLERLIDLSPDLVMAYGMGPQDKSLSSLKKTGIPVVLNADFMEQTPLGRAEWIKFTAAFLNKEKEADSVFTTIKNRYDSLASLTEKVEKKPAVFSGIVYNGTWFMPGGKSWASVFFSDAGARYLWADNMETGSLQLSFEAVVDKAQQASYWIGVADYSSLQALADADSRYQYFEAWQQGQVYTYTAKKGATGGYEYLESGYSRPDIVLADLIKIIHPELLPAYDLYFYERLEEK